MCHDPITRRVYCVIVCTLSNTVIFILTSFITQTQSVKCFLWGLSIETTQRAQCDHSQNSQNYFHPSPHWQRYFAFWLILAQFSNIFPTFKHCCFSILEINWKPACVFPTLLMFNTYCSWRKLGGTVTCFSELKGKYLFILTNKTWFCFCIRNTPSWEELMKWNWNIIKWVVSGFLQ